MKRYLNLPVIAGLVLIFSACSPIPKATVVEQEPQIKLQSAQNWGIIARHLSAKIVEGADLKGKSLFIDDNNFQTSFSRVFSKQLTSQLVNKNVGMVISPTSETLELIINVDVLRHPSDRDTGTTYPLTAGLANIWLIAETGAYGAIPTIVAADYLNSLPSETNTEIAITTRVLDGSHINFSETNVYYITDKSINQFKEIGTVKLTDKELPRRL